VHDLPVQESPEVHVTSVPVVMQVPDPSHTKSVSVVLFLQLELHAVMTAAYSHASMAEPVQVPPQVEPVPTQGVRVPCGAPLVTVAHFPGTLPSHA
jgi:hypothetical protein